MKNSAFTLYLSFSTVLFSACMKDELPVPAQPRGGAEQLQACLGPGYAEQVWIDLGERRVVATNPRHAWDLAFESAPQGWRIWLNGSKLMTVWNAGEQVLEAPTDTTGMGPQRRIDAPSGHPDSTAFGDWQGRSDLYVVDLGFNTLGQPLGLRKVKVDWSGGSYRLRSALLDGSNVQEHLVTKDALRHHTSFSFANGVVDVEPPAGSWDIALTSYTHQFYEPYMPYLVTGALIAPDVRVARIAGKDPSSITLADTIAYPYSDHRNTIGYDWKEYSFDLGSYTVDPRLGFIVQDGGGYFHRLRFTDFYGSTGQVGCPAFEVVEL
ncbi:MAG: hypothetical protein JNM31_10910 [Flavobacteriales bacterium]|nr:hypothetical protein [Flavobacteriales bacterium]